MEQCMTINMVKEYAGMKGYTARVGHNSNVDYLQMAYIQALSIKITQKDISNYAVLVDQETANQIEKHHQEVFDSIVVVPGVWGFDNEWQVRNYSPWHRTVKLDVDMLFLNDIGNWWNTFDKQKILFTSNVEDYKGKTITSRWHRKLFDDNHLPDIYTAFYYYKDGVESAEFFELCAEISNNWSWFAKEFLIKNNNTNPRDDEIFSIAVRIYGEENCTIPNAAYPKFVHFKETLNTLPAGKPWHEQLHVEWNDRLWIGHYPQRLPLHYCSKTFITPELVEHYEQNYKKLFKGNTQ